MLTCPWKLQCPLLLLSLLWVRIPRVWQAQDSAGLISAVPFSSCHWFQLQAPSPPQNYYTGFPSSYLLFFLYSRFDCFIARQHTCSKVHRSWVCSWNGFFPMDVFMYTYFRYLRRPPRMFPLSIPLSKANTILMAPARESFGLCLNFIRMKWFVMASLLNTGLRDSSKLRRVVVFIMVFSYQRPLYDNVFTWFYHWWTSKLFAVQGYDG